MPKDGKEVAIGLGITGVAIGTIYFATRAKAEPPPPPPPPGLANLYGIVTDAETGKKIKDVLVTLNGYSTLTNPAGYYQFTDIEPGSYMVEFSKEGYLTEVF